jgi:hypothetical protein
MLLIDKKVWTKGVAHLKKNDKVMARIIRKIGSVEFKIEDGPLETVSTFVPSEFLP